ncbi:uncharacterized protein JCM15063_005629 [Sporobolomyces koalae]|uniref:uncharacterized protein n=1 Tax=Sporobolomyces koalae TaxID=500713 RepID=UPI00316B2705
MSFPSTSTGFSAFSAGHPSAFGSTSTAASGSSRSQVAFGAIPGSHPGVLSWGFGMSSANRGGTGWGTGAAASTSSNMTTPAPAPAPVQWGSQSPQANPRRRRRSSTPPTPPATDVQLPVDSSRPILSPVATKRARKATPVLAPPTDRLAQGLVGSLSLGSGTASPTSATQDLGKSLASLDKPALLRVFSSLLATHPHLAPTVTALLPPPTLAATLDAITDQTRQLLASIPSNSSPAYIHSRMRLPLESFVQEMKKILQVFVPSQPSPSNPSEGDLLHPTTTMTLLLHLTHSFVTISQSLPPAPPTTTPAQATNSILHTHLLPTLINSYHVFLTKLSTSINHEGKVLPLSTLQTWFEQMDQLVTARGDAVTTRALEGVRDRMRREMGWLVGIKPTVMNGQSMQGVET